MAEKVLKTRIQLKHDTYSNWQNSSLVLKDGEIAICTVPAAAGAVNNEPAILMKVGNGTDVFSDLPWVSGLAADTNTYSKMSDAAFVAAIEALAQGEDTNTTYQIVQVTESGNVTGYKLQYKNIGDSSWTDGSTIAVKTLVEKYAVTNITAATAATDGTVRISYTKNGTATNVDATVKGFTNKADKVSEATAGNFAGLDANGNLTDSGKKAADFDAAGAAAAAKSEVIGASTDASSASTIYGAKKYADEKASGAASGKADKVANATNGNFAGLDTNGNLTDSGKKAADFATAAQGTKADSAIQSVEFAGTTLTVNSSKKASITQADARTALGLGTAAYENSSAFDAAGAAATAKSEVIGASTDASTASTIHGAKKYTDEAKAAVIGSNSDTDTSNTIYGAKKYADKILSEFQSGSFKVVAGKSSVTNPQTGVIYLIPKTASVSEGGKGAPSGTTGYVEWIYVNSSGSTYAWEEIGDTDVDLSGYSTKEYKVTAVTSGNPAIRTGYKLQSRDIGSTGAWTDVSTSIDFTTEMTKLNGIAAGAQVNVIENIKAPSTSGGTATVLPVTDKTVTLGYLATKNSITTDDITDIEEIVWDCGTSSVS